VHGADEVAPLLTVSEPGVIVEAVKLADDGSGDVVVRLYEALGSARTAQIEAGFPVAAVTQTDLLEREIEPTALRETTGTVRLDLAPFQLVTLRLAR